jgi:hypothetical protein
MMRRCFTLQISCALGQYGCIFLWLTADPPSEARRLGYMALLCGEYGARARRRLGNRSSRRMSHE